MTTNLNIDLLFKKYSEYFTYSQSTSTQKHLEQKPFAKKVKVSMTTKDQFKDEAVKLKSNKSTKLKPKHDAKQVMTQTKKTKATLSTKITPRPHIVTKPIESKIIKTDHKPSKSITPDKRPRKSLNKPSANFAKKINEKTNCQNEVENILRKHRKSKSKERTPNLMTDRSSKIKTERSKSRDGNPLKPSHQKLKANKLKTKGLKKQNRQYPTMRTEYVFDNQIDSSQDQWLNYIPSRMKLKNQELYQDQQYETPRRSEDHRYFNIPIVSSRQEKNIVSSKQMQQERQSEMEQYYKQQIQRLKQQQEQKWKRAINILKEYKQIGDKEMIDKLIDESEFNRISLNHKDDEVREDRFKKYKSLYDEDNVRSHNSLTKDKIDIIKSRQASSKRLIEDLQNAQYNQIQLQQHFSNQKQENLLGSHHLNIQQYLLSQSKKGERSPRDESPQFQRIQHQAKQSSRSNENSLIDFIQNELRDAQNQKQAERRKNISVDIFQQIFQQQMQSFATQMVKHHEILHSFLQWINFNTNKVIVKEEQKVIEVADKITCKNSFILQLTRKFLEYIEKSQLTEFNRAICIPFGERPEKMMKFMRQSGEERDQNQGTYQSIIPVSLFIDFEPTLKETINMSSALEQYFFNHCVFDCINQNLDKLRPFGSKGLPPLCFQTAFVPLEFEKIESSVMANIRNTLSFMIGRQIDQEEEDDAFQIIDRTFRRLDKLILAETDIEWKDNNDLQFELKYDISISVIDWIFKEQAKYLVNFLF